MLSLLFTGWLSTDDSTTTDMKCQLSLAHRYKGSDRTTAQKTYPLPSNGCPPLLRSRSNVLTESLLSNRYMRTHKEDTFLQHLFYICVRFLEIGLHVTITDMIHWNKWLLTSSFVTHIRRHVHATCSRSTIGCYGNPTTRNDNNKSQAHRAF
jgi:hypothetical protein